MSAGYVYILINSSFIDLIKIGCTTYKSEERAKQISSNTGVPTPFIVAFEMYVDDCKKFEKEIHKKLYDYRVSPNREFFRYPLHKTIELMYELKKQNYTAGQDKFEAINISQQLLDKYPSGINSAISSMKIIQTNERVYFEVTKDDYIGDNLKDQHITRTDLAFIVEDELENYTFDIAYEVSQNAQIFLELDNDVMVNCFSEIFNDDKADELWEDYRQNFTNNKL